MIEPPAVVPPGMSPRNPETPKSGAPELHNMTSEDLDGLDVAKIRCIGCLSYGSCNNKMLFMVVQKSPIFICAQRKAIYEQENGLDLPF